MAYTSLYTYLLYLFHYYNAGFKDFYVNIIFFQSIEKFIGPPISLYLVSKQNFLLVLGLSFFKCLFIDF